MVTGGWSRRQGQINIAGGLFLLRLLLSRLLWLRLRLLLVLLVGLHTLKEEMSKVYGSSEVKVGVVMSMDVLGGTRKQIQVVVVIGKEICGSSSHQTMERLVGVCVGICVCVCVRKCFLSW